MMGLAMNQMRVAKNQWGQRVTAPGCDDAPVVDVEIGVEAKPVVIIKPYFENPKTLRDLIRGFANLRLDAPISLCVVDDCSSETPASEAIRGEAIPPNFSLYRVKEKARWNWLAARNIAAHEAPEGSWLAMTDMDHAMPFTTVVGLAYGDQRADTIYRFTRHEGHQGGPILPPHKNSWFMTREMFFHVGGYNEAFSGHYGSDGEFRRRCARTAPIAVMNRPLVRREFDRDSSTTTYGRKELQDQAVHRIAAEWQGPPKVLSFPYERVL